MFRRDAQSAIVDLMKAVSRIEARGEEKRQHDAEHENQLLPDGQVVQSDDSPLKNLLFPFFPLRFPILPQFCSSFKTLMMFFTKEKRICRTLAANAFL